MSLIINMLKDLDKHHQPSKTVPKFSFRKSKTKHTTPLIQGYRHLLSITLSLGAFAALVFISMTAIKNNAHYNQIAALLSDVNITSPNAGIINDPILTQADINSITIQPTDNTVALLFNVSHTALYAINVKKNNILQITFNNTSLKSPVPDVSAENMIIKNITATTNSDNTIFELTLNPDWKLQSTEMISSHGHHHLALNIEGPAQPAKQEIPVSNVKKRVNADSINERYQNALAKAQVGNTSAAINMLTSLLLEAPLHHRSRSALIALQLETGKYSDAEQALNQGVKLSPGYVPYIELRARILAIRNDLDGAIALLQRQSPEIHDYPDYYAFLAAMYQRTNHDTMAVNLYNQLIRIEPKNANWWFGLALSNDKIGNRKEAIYAYTRAMSRGNLNTASFNYLQSRLTQLKGVENEAY